jgi:hypothetical protein
MSFLPDKKWWISWQYLSNVLKNYLKIENNLGSVLRATVVLVVSWLFQYY